MGTEVLIRKQCDAFNRHDAKAFAACYATTAVVADPQFPDSLKGIDAITKDVADWFSAFPDIVTSLMCTVLNGDSYAAEWSMSGTHKGALVMPDGHVPATGKAVRINVATIGRMDSAGRIVEERRYYDLSSVMSQLGLMQ